MKNRWRAKAIAMIVLVAILTVAGVLAQPQYPENCMTLHFDFEEFGVKECANGNTIILHSIDQYPPMVNTTKRPVSLTWLTEKWGKPQKIGNNPSIYVWARVFPFRRVTALELNGQPGIDLVMLRQTDVILLHPTPTPVRGGDGF